MEDFRRARSPEQKQQRLDEILSAADRLFAEGSYPQITLTTVAEALGWSRGNLYKYVSTKEEIFLSLYARKQRAFTSDLARSMEGLPLPAPREEFARRWAEALGRHQDYLRYHGILATILEANVPLPTLSALKKASYADREPAFRLLRGQCPSLPEKEMRAFFFTLLYQGCGLYTHVHYAPVVAEALRQAGLPVPQDEFVPMFYRFFEAALHYYEDRLKEKI